MYYQMSPYTKYGIPHRGVSRIFMPQDSNPTKCNADERCRRGLDRGEPLFSPNGRKCKSSPVSGTIKGRNYDTIS